MGMGFGGFPIQSGRFTLGIWANRRRGERKKGREGTVGGIMGKWRIGIGGIGGIFALVFFLFFLSSFPS